MNSRNLRVWLGLLLFTLLSFYLADASAEAGIVLLILAAAVVKGQLVVGEFMQLRGVAHPLRWGMLLYCPVLGGLIFLVLRLAAP